MAFNNIFNHTQIQDLIRQYINADQSIMASKYIKYFEKAEEDNIFPIIDEELYNQILSTTSPNFERIKRNLIATVIYYGIDSYLPMQNLTIDVTGPKQTSTESVKPASDSSIMLLTKNLRQLGSESLEKFLEMIENSQDPIFNTWKNSEKYTVLNQRIINTAKNMSNILGIKINRRIFLAMATNLANEEFSLQKALGNLWDIIVDSTDQKHTFLLNNYIKPAIAKNTFAKSIPSLAINFSEEDIISIFDNTSGGNITKRNKSFDSQSILFYQNSFKDAAKEHYDNMIDYINSNLEDYPEYPKTDFFTGDRGPLDLGLITVFR